MRRPIARPAPTFRSLALAGASLIALCTGSNPRIANAQEATSPRRGVGEPTAQGSVRLEELTVEARDGTVSRVVAPRENPRGPIDGFVAKRTLTSTKTDTPIIEAPQSISVVGRQQLDAQKATSVSEALQYVPGVFGSPFGPDPRFDFFLIRGFTASDTGLYRDGLQLLNFGFGSYKVDQFGLERIDILRGPAAVLFGQGSPGGVVNLVSKKPTLDAFGYAEAGGGSFGQKYFNFDVGGPADPEGHLFYRLTATGRNGGTQVEGVPDNAGYIAPAFTWKPDGSTTFTVLTSFQHDETGRINAFLPYEGTVRRQALGLRIPYFQNTQDPIQNRFRRTQAMVGYEFEHVFDDTWTVRQNARFAFAQTYDNSLGGGIGYEFGDLTQTRLGRYRFQATSTQRLFNVDTQAVARFDDGLFRHTFLMGVDYKYFGLNDNQAIAFGVDPFNILAPNYGTPTPVASPYLVNFDVFQQTGIYVQDQIKLTPELTLVVSGRGDFTTNDVKSKLFGTQTNQSANAATERFALIYNTDFGLAPYISYATSFNPQVGTNFFGQPFKPTTGDQYEGGIKFQPVGTDILFTAAAFDLALANALSVDANNPLNNVQLGLVRSRGLEGSVVANITPNFNVVASATTYKLENVQGDNVGKTPVGVPQTFLSVFGDYTIPTGDWAGFGGGGGVRYVGSSFANLDNTLKVPERVLFDTLVHYTRGNWRLAVNAANIFDKRFVSSCTSINACFYGEARRVTASLSYKW